MTDLILGPGEGERHTAGPSAFVIKTTADENDGGLFLCEATIPPGAPTPPPHCHERMTDMFYVLEGTLTVHLAGESSLAGPGTFVRVPPGTVHTFANEGDADVRILNLSTPGGWEYYMRDLAAGLSSDRPPSEVFADLVARHDVSFNV